MRFSTTLLLLASATLAFAQEAVLSKATRIGEDKTDKGAYGPAIYEHDRNHQTAAASILTFIAERSNYAPSEQDPAKAAEGLDEFERRFRNVPAFKEKESEYKTVHLKGGLDDLQAKIEEAHPDYKGVNVGKSLRRLVPRYNSDRKLRHWGLSTVMIYQNALLHTHVRVVTLRVRLETSKDGEVDVPEQYARLFIDAAELDRDYLKEHAEFLAAKIDTTTTEEYKKYFTSKRPSPFDLDAWLESC